MMVVCAFFFSLSCAAGRGVELFLFVEFDILFESGIVCVGTGCRRRFL